MRKTPPAMGRAGGPAGSETGFGAGGRLTRSSLGVPAAASVAGATARSGLAGGGAGAGVVRAAAATSAAASRVGAAPLAGLRAAYCRPGFAR